MDPGKMLPLSCFLLCIQPAGQNESEANAIPSSNWVSEDTSQGRKTSKSSKELLYVTNPQMQGQSRMYVQEGLHVSPPPAQGSTYRALHPLGFSD